MAERDPDCIFCGIAAGDSPAEIVASDERTISFMDINPATPGHSLVIPRTHSTDLYDVPEDDLLATTSAARGLALRMRDALDPGGINLLNSCGRPAWQSVFHFHIHVIPRYAGDPLELPWLPEGGDPEEIAKVAAKLRGD